MADVGSLMQRPRENVVRGALLSAVAIPVSVIAWDLLWTLGIIASIVAFGIAWVAATLYRRGSGGEVSFVGEWVVAGVVTVGLLLSFSAGLLTDYVLAVSTASGVSPLETLRLAEFWPYFTEDFGAMLENNRDRFGLAALFAVIGAYSVVHHARMVTPADPSAPVTVVPPRTAR